MDTAPHSHAFSIIVGNAPVTMMAGKNLPEFRACQCGVQVYTGSYFYDPDE